MKTEKILELLRHRIVSGEFPPGVKLPNRPELLKEYSVSVSAFQKCINQLIAWGFLESRGMYGMCVKVNPPHLCRFAVLLPIKADKILVETDSLIVAFKQVINDYVAENKGISFAYYNVGPMAAPEMDEWERFYADAQSNLLAGAIDIFVAPPVELQRKLGDFPNVVVSLKREDAPHHSPNVEFDLVEMFRQQMQYLGSKGCKNVAALLNDNMSIAKILSIIDIAEKSEINCPRRWIQGMNQEHTRALFYDNLLELLFAPDQKSVPDGLIVQNENFLPMVMNTFSRIGVVPGEHVKIASHGNWPSMRAKIAGVDYISFSVAEVLSECMLLLRKWQSGKLDNKEINILIAPKKIEG